MGYILLYVFLQFAFTAWIIRNAFRLGVRTVCNRIIRNMMNEHQMDEAHAKSFLLAISGVKGGANVRPS